MVTGRSIITRIYQGSAGEVTAASKAGTDLFLVTSGSLAIARVTRFEWMSQATYDALGTKYDTTLYIINPSSQGAGTAHRWPVAADLSTALYLGTTAVAAAYIGDTQVSAAGPIPTITLDAGESNPSNQTDLVFDVVFNESVTGFATGDIVVNGTAGGTAVVAGTGTTYTVTVSGLTDGWVSITVPAGCCQNGSAEDNVANTSAQVTVDQTDPDVTITPVTSSPTASGTIEFTAVFTEAVTGLTSGEITVNGTGGGSVTGLSGSGTTYTITVTGATDGTVGVTIPAAAAQDAAGNNNTEGVSSLVTVDQTGPTVTINQAAGQADPTTTNSAEFTVVFSESVTGFTADDVTISGTATGGSVAVSGSGTTYTVTVSGLTGYGTVIATVDAGAVTDALGNPSAASTSTDNTVTYAAASAATMPSTGLYLPGTTGNYVSTPDDASLDITGDICLVAHVAMNDWTPGTFVNFISKSGGAVADTSYELGLSNANQLRYVFGDGTSFPGSVSSVVPTVNDGDPLWIAVTHDVSGLNTKFWTSTDGTSWSQLGTDRAVTAGPIQATTSELRIGARANGSQPLTGSVYYAAVYDGIGANTAPGQGTLVYEADFSHPWVGNRYTDSTGKVSTINGSAFAWEVV